LRGLDQSQSFRSAIPFRQEQTAQAARAEIYLDKDVTIFTDMLLHNVTGEGAEPTILPWPAARAEARAPLFAMLPRLERPPCV